MTLAIIMDVFGPFHARVFLLCGSLLLTAPGFATQDGPPKSNLPEGPSKAVTERVCGACHGAGKVAKRRATREGWADIVDEMIRRGADGSDEEFAEIIDYLAKHFPLDPEPTKKPNGR